MNCRVSDPPFPSRTQNSGADVPLRKQFLHHPKKGSFKTTITPFSRSGWSVVRSALLANGGTSKARPSPHLHKVPTPSNNVSPRNLQTAFKLLYLNAAIKRIKTWTSIYDSSETRTRDSTVRATQDLKYLRPKRQ
jgi:hypothetical protein